MIPLNNSSVEYLVICHTFGLILVLFVALVLVVDGVAGEGEREVVTELLQLACDVGQLASELIMFVLLH